MLNCTIGGYLRGDDHPLAGALNRVECDASDELVETLRLIPDHVDEDHFPNSDYVVNTLQTALHDALTANRAEDAIVLLFTAVAIRIRLEPSRRHSPAHASGTSRCLTGGSIPSSIVTISNSLRTHW